MTRWGLLIRALMILGTGCTVEFDSRDKDTADDDDETDGGCILLSDGTWTFSISTAPEQLPTSALSFDDASCHFGLTSWSSADDLPTGGDVVGDEVVLEGEDSYWSTCSGTTDSNRYVEGTCSSDGATWVLSADR